MTDIFLHDNFDRINVILTVLVNLRFIAPGVATPDPGETPPMAGPARRILEKYEGIFIRIVSAN
jgi:hypothetical protein